MMKKVLTLIFAAGMLSLAGCGGNNTPEATFQAMQKAAAKQDIKAFAACFMPDDKKAELAAMVVCGSAETAQAFAKLEVVEKKHPVADEAEFVFKKTDEFESIKFKQRDGVWYALSE